ncbi:MAG: 16S rRNA (uracil(1498)-N(3))-methyltransferase [Acetobacteraceae bacterium]|nr:16S rRNA (uracil(1498)-N(3))-methyltransferase [Acetobacteraceae bacterium]
MSIPRLFCGFPLSEGAEVALTPAQAHHVGTVLRRGPGDSLHAFNAEDGEFAAELTVLRKDRGAMRLGARCRAPVPEPAVTLLLAALKREAMDWAVEKATELGVARIRPVLTRRCVATHVNAERLSAIARGAAEQSERLSVPVVESAQPLHAVLERWDGSRLLVGAERREAAGLHSLLAGLSAPVAWLVGPEGGFEPHELDVLARAPFVSLASLGPRILRAETAAVAGLGSIVFALDGRALG